MRTACTIALALLLPACGRESISLRGNLLADSGATEVWIAGAAPRAAVEADSFVLDGVVGDTIDLRFGDGEDEVGRMLITGASSASSVVLQDVWLEDEIAFPTRLALEGGGRLIVNGIRMGDAAAVPAQVSVTATVLAGGDDALLVRPVDDELPDLRVVVLPTTVVRTEDGDPVELEVEFGDSVRVTGEGQRGYVMALEIVLPRTSARASGQGGRGGREPRSSPAPALAAENPASVGATRGGRDRSEDPKPGKGKGKGKTKGRDKKGKG